MARTWKGAAAIEFARNVGDADPEQAIRRVARDLLRETGGSGGLGAVLEALGVRRVRTKEMILEGALKAAPDGRFDVWVRADRSSVRQRFSLAHECGHILFFRLAPLAKRRQIDAGEVADEEEERLCNVAAEELLMPQLGMEVRIAGADCPLAIVQQTVTDCGVSYPAALLRVASMWPRPGILQLFEYDRRWNMALARTTCSHRIRSAAYQPDHWGPNELAAAARGILPQSAGWLIDRSTSTVVRAWTRTAAIGAGKRLSFLCFHALDVRAGVADRLPGSLDRLGAEIRRIARSIGGRESCSACRGTGWHERTRDIVELCECRLSQARSRIAQTSTPSLVG